MARKNLHASEHDEQAAYFEWIELESKRYPDLALTFAIPNGGHRHLTVAKKLKREGVKAGVPDIMLPAARHVWHGLFIEMKARKGGRVTAPQNRWIVRLREQSYRVLVCYGWDEARDRTLEYIKWDRPTMLLGPDLKFPAHPQPEVVQHR